MLKKEEKKNLFLKKSYNVRKLLDILIYSPYVIMIQKNNLDKKNMKQLMLFCLDKKISNFLINKDNFTKISFSNFAQGPSIIFYSNFFFYKDLELFFKDHGLKFKIVLNKNKIFVSNIINELILYKVSSFASGFSLMFFYLKMFNSLFLNFFYNIKKIYSLLNYFLLIRLLNFLYLFNYFLYKFLKK